MKVTKLKIYKNKRVADRDNLFNYVFEWISGDTVVWKETLKMSADELYKSWKVRGESQGIDLNIEPEFSTFQTLVLHLKCRKS